MGRSSRKQADENRARIVETASGLFRAYGVDAISIADVMKAAGMTQGGFYKHFLSKDVLAAEACALAFDQAVANWRKVADDARARGDDGGIAIAEYYASDRPPSMTCPMIAFAPNAERSSEGNPLRTNFSKGVELLYGTFVELSGDDGSPDIEQRRRAQFAAMVGSNILARSSRHDGWQAKLQDANKLQ